MCWWMPSWALAAAPWTGRTDAGIPPWPSGHCPENSGGEHLRGAAGVVCGHDPDQRYADYDLRLPLSHKTAGNHCPTGDSGEQSCPVSGGGLPGTLGAHGRHGAYGSRGAVCPGGTAGRAGGERTSMANSLPPAGAGAERPHPGDTAPCRGTGAAAGCGAAAVLPISLPGRGGRPFQGDRHAVERPGAGPGGGRASGAASVGQAPAGGGSLPS